MKKKKMLGTFMLMVPLMIIGCEKNDKSPTGKNGVVSTISGRKEFKGIKIKVSKDLEQINTTQDMLLYKIGDSKRSIRISADHMNADMDSYIKNVKEVLGKSIDLSNSKDGKITVNNKEMVTLEYKYDINEKQWEIYQVCFNIDETAYIITLWSDKENLEQDKNIVQELIENIK